ncbi:MAG: 2-oxoacid:acceptor oxidoreductase family protein [Planctomycetota bacterium]
MARVTKKTVKSRTGKPARAAKPAAADCARGCAAEEGPFKNGFFEIRFESIGGLGAHAAGQILAGAAVMRMGYNAAHFSSYGSEKKGSPVKSNVRVGPGDRPIRTSAPIDRPDVIVMFHPALLANPATLSGLKKDGTLILNAPAGPLPKTLERLPKTAKLVRLDALKIAIETKSRPNAVLLGTLSAIFPFLKGKELLEMLSEEFAGKHPEAVASNEKAFTRGGSEFEVVEGVGRADGAVPVTLSEPFYGYDTAPLGGMVPVAGNTAWNTTAMSRTGFMPVLDSEHCIHCGVCDLVCPDLCLVWEAEGAENGGMPVKTKLVGVDYRYCKGCMRCVESCPTGALSKQPETPGLADKLRKPLFPGLIP